MCMQSPFLFSARASAILWPSPTGNHTTHFMCMLLVCGLVKSFTLLCVQVLLIYTNSAVLYSTFCCFFLLSVRFLRFFMLQYCHLLSLLLLLQSPLVGSSPCYLCSLRLDDGLQLLHTLKNQWGNILCRGPVCDTLFGEIPSVLSPYWWPQHSPPPTVLGAFVTLYLANPLYYLISDFAHLTGVKQ